MATEHDRKPWDRQPEESSRAFHAFTHFRDLPSWERSLDRAYNVHREHCKFNGNGHRWATDETHPAIAYVPTRACADWRIWRAKYNWDARTDVHDAELAEQDRQARLREITAMNARHTALAVALQNQVVANLQKLGNAAMELNPREMALLAEKASTIERRARGQATEIFAREDGEKLPLDLSRLDEQELEVFQALIAKAQPQALKE
jgi:hypothetical protein